MIAIVDYGVGNLFSLVSSLKYIGAEAEVTSDSSRICAAQKVILPGVGAFGDAAQRLKLTHLDKEVISAAKEGKPVLGICLGMQLLFEKSFEYGEHAGLCLLNGKVCDLSKSVSGIKIPHMGWNSLNFIKKSELFKYVSEGEYVYFVHSYHAVNCQSSLVATAEYGIPVTAAVQNKNVFGTQFHPEKSGDVGLRILKAFSEM